MFFVLSARLLSVVANDAVKGYFLQGEKLLLARSKATSCGVKSYFLQNGAEMGGATAENAEKKNPGQDWSGLLIYVSEGGFLLLKKRAVALLAYLNSSSRRV